MDGHMPATEYTKELDSAVEAVKTSEEWRREYMTLFLRDRENVRLGKYADKVELIRHHMNAQPINIIASFVILAEQSIIRNRINLSFSLIGTHTNIQKRPPAGEPSDMYLHQDPVAVLIWIVIHGSMSKELRFLINRRYKCSSKPSNKPINLNLLLYLNVLDFILMVHH